MYISVPLSEFTPGVWTLDTITILKNADVVIFPQRFYTFNVIGTRKTFLHLATRNAPQKHQRKHQDNRKQNYEVSMCTLMYPTVNSPQVSRH